jgi:hypothetical protein
MMNSREINDLHDRAMEFAGNAFYADVRGDYATAANAFQQAYELERRAALLLVDYPSAEPSRSVLLRSAASLALDCQQFREAERLVAIALAGDPPDEICEELRDVLEMAYFRRHLSLRGIELDSGELQVALTGQAVGCGIAESGEFLRRAEVMEKVLIRTVERLHGLPFRESGSPSKKTMEGFEIFWSTPRAASFAVSIRLGRPMNCQQLLPGFACPKDVLDDFLGCVRDFDADSVDALRKRITDESYFNNFVALARKLAPDGERISSVGFTSIRRNQREEVALTHRARTEVHGNHEPTSTVEVVGTVRSADERSTRRHPAFGVEDDQGKTQNVVVQPGILQDIVRPFWGERVRVLAGRKQRRLELIDIQPANSTSTTTA